MTGRWQRLQSCHERACCEDNAQTSGGPPPPDVPQDLPRCIGARCTCDPAARMPAGTAEIEPSNRRSILLEAAGRAQQKDLIETHLAMVPMTAGQQELALQILRRQYLLRTDTIGKV